MDPSGGGGGGGAVPLAPSRSVGAVLSKGNVRGENVHGKCPDLESLSTLCPWVHIVQIYNRCTGAALLENNEASAKLTTANGGTFTSSSARLE